MYGLLILIGLLAVLYWIGKLLNKAGDFFIGLQRIMADRYTEQQAQAEKEKTEFRREFRDIRKRLQHIKGESDENKNQIDLEEVRKEIDELTS